MNDIRSVTKLTKHIYLNKKGIRLGYTTRDNSRVKYLLLLLSGSHNSPFVCYVDLWSRWSLSGRILRDDEDLHTLVSLPDRSIQSVSSTTDLTNNVLLFNRLVSFYPRLLTTPKSGQLSKFVLTFTFRPFVLSRTRKVSYILPLFVLYSTLSPGPGPTDHSSLE